MKELRRNKCLMAKNVSHAFYAFFLITSFAGFHLKNDSENKCEITKPYPLIQMWQVEAHVKGEDGFMPKIVIWSDGFVTKARGGSNEQGAMLTSELHAIQRTIRSAGFFDYKGEYGFAPTSGWGMICILVQDTKGKRAMCCPVRMPKDYKITSEYTEFLGMWNHVAHAIDAVHVYKTKEDVPVRELRHPDLYGEWSGLGVTHLMRQRQFQEEISYCSGADKETLIPERETGRSSKVH